MFFSSVDVKPEAPITAGGLMDMQAAPGRTITDGLHFCTISLCIGVLHRGRIVMPGYDWFRLNLVQIRFSSGYVWFRLCFFGTHTGTAMCLPVTMVTIVRACLHWRQYVRSITTISKPETQQQWEKMRDFNVSSWFRRAGMFLAGRLKTNSPVLCTFLSAHERLNNKKSEHGGKFFLSAEVKRFTLRLMKQKEVFVCFCLMTAWMFLPRSSSSADLLCCF